MLVGSHEEDVITNDSEREQPKMFKLFFGSDVGQGQTRQFV
jgi:hypothetical protein